MVIRGHVSSRKYVQRVIRGRHGRRREERHGAPHSPTPERRTPGMI
jgi:hypothetical protein